MDPRFLRAGDTALVVEFGDRTDRVLSDAVLQLSGRVRHAQLPGVIETVPTFRSLLVHYDPTATCGANLIEALRALVHAPKAEAARGRLWHVPACYAPECAPDLEEVATRTRLSSDEVVRLHSQTQFHVYMIGFAPGFPYMGDLDPRLSLPRRVDPRVRVPPGSIAIASTMSAIYPIESPGGWHLIGRTPIRLFNPNWERPSLLAPGDALRCEPIGLSEYQRVKAAVDADDYSLTFEEIAA